MPVSLSRIEREYVVRNLEDMPSPLSILVDNTLVHVAENAYTLSGERISIHGWFQPEPRSYRIRVFFRHKQRGLFFLASAERLAPNGVSFTISNELFKEDIATPGDRAQKLEMRSGSRVFEARVVPAWPLDCVMIDPAVSLERETTIRKIAERVGIPEANPLLACRLFDYLDAFRDPERLPGNGSGFGDFIYIDHEYALVSVRNAGKGVLKTGQDWMLRIAYGKRHIGTDSLLRGTIPVHSGLDVVSLSIASAQEEDKRFLFEALNKSKYQG